MKRDVYQALLAWKHSPGRKPLLLKGARQTGKTWLLKEFGRNEYESLAYFNFEEDSGLGDIFGGNLNPRRIIEHLSLYQRRDIKPERDLIVLDEIQASNSALNALKYFQEEAGECHVAAAGSLLGVKLSTPKSFPVGKVNFLNLAPMSFMEFLSAVGEDRYRQLIEEAQTSTPFPQPFHDQLIGLLKIFYWVGGMPEAVRCYAESRDWERVRTIQNEIVNSYVLDFAKHAPGADIPKLTHIWDSIPSQLARENRKFMFSAVEKSARAHGYENAVLWLEDAGIINRAFRVASGKAPLAGYVDRRSFKVYALDVGLLSAMCRLPASLIVTGHRIFDEYKGAFVESYVAQQLKAAADTDLFYWKNAEGTAEVDFVCQFDDGIYPLEVKAGLNPKSKSLKVYDALYGPPCLLRSTLLNLKMDGKILNCPLYAISRLPALLRKTN